MKNYVRIVVWAAVVSLVLSVSAGPVTAQDEANPSAKEPAASAEPVPDVAKTEASGAAAPAQKLVPWIYRPYQVEIWLLLDSSPRWTDPVVAALKQELQQQLELVEPAAWRLSVKSFPATEHVPLRSSPLRVEHFGTDLYDGMQASAKDKLFVVRVQDQNSKIHVSVNEMDCTGWSLGPSYSRNLVDSQKLSYAVSDLVCESFRPIARIENLLTENVMMAVRAYGLMFRAVQDGEEWTEVPAKDSPCWIEEKEIFEPVIRKANRQKVFALEKLEYPEFTLLLQEGKTEAPTIECRVVSAKRAEAALGRRSGKQTERYGIVVRTPPGKTAIQLVTLRGPSLSDLTEFPLNGYEIYSRSIYGTDDKTEYIGKTDWTGEIDIFPGSEEEPVRLLYVKSGERLLARLPVMPGYKPHMKQILPDDETRINAEGVVSGLRAQVLDLVARREVLLFRIEQGLLKGASDLQNTLAYYELYDDLMTLADWQELLANTQRRLQTTDKRQQTKIDAMFVELQTFAQDEVNPLDDSEIAPMILAAKQGQWDSVRDMVLARQSRKKAEADAEKAAAGEPTE